MDILKSFRGAFVNSDRTKAHLCILFVAVQTRCAGEMGYMFCIKNLFVRSEFAVCGASTYSNESVTLQKANTIKLSL